LDTKNQYNWRIDTENASKAHVTNSLWADRELVTAMSLQLSASYSLNSLIFVLLERRIFI
jgi:hypothetical protein